MRFEPNKKGTQRQDNLVRRTYYWGIYKQLIMRWIAGTPSYSWMGSNSIFNTHGEAPGRVYGKTLPHMKGLLKQTGLLEWIYGHHMVAHPDAYFSTRAKVPQFEQIWKAGLFRLADECEQGSGNLGGVIKEPQSTVLTKALGIDKSLLNRLRRNNGGAAFLHWLQVEKQTGKRISDEVIHWFCEQEIKRHSLNFIWDKMNAVQIYNYLRRQAEASKESVQQVLIPNPADGQATIIRTAWRISSKTSGTKPN